MIVAQRPEAFGGIEQIADHPLVQTSRTSPAPGSGSAPNSAFREGDEQREREHVERGGDTLDAIVPDHPPPVRAQELEEPTVHGASAPA